MIGSKIMNIAGSTSRTTSVLITAPLDRRFVIPLIISTFEYRPTPKVAAKKLHPLIMIDFIEVRCAMDIASFFDFPSPLSF